MPNMTASTQGKSRGVEVFPIRSEGDLEKALEQINALMNTAQAGSDDEDRLEVLSTLVEAYEEEHYPIPPAKAVDAIKFRLDQMGLTPKALEPILGTRARVYEVLHGKRTLSAEMMAKLWSKFQVPLESLISAAAKRVRRRKRRTDRKKRSTRSVAVSRRNSASTARA
jgi:HTH-type transcriptional regulator/antitoxin HigA